MGKTNTRNTIMKSAKGRLSDDYWNPWISELMNLATQNDITTSDDADLWWDDFCSGMTPQESMQGFLDSMSNHKLLANLIPKMREVQDAIFDRECDFLEEFCGEDAQELLGVWLGGDNCKFVWITIEGQHLTDNQPVEVICDFLS